MEALMMIFFAALVPAAFLAFTYWMDRHQPEPLSQLAKGVLLGGVVALLSLSFTAILHNAQWIYIGDIRFWSHVRQAFFGAALPEEVSKWIMLWLLLRNNKYFDEFLDGIIYAVFIAMGFAFVENICYCLTNPAQWELVITGRSLLSVPAHFCYAVVMGVCFSYGFFQRRRGIMALSLLMPIALHFLFDFCLVSVMPSTSQGDLIGVVVVFVVLLGAMGAFAYRGIRTTREEDERVHQALQRVFWKSMSFRPYIVLGVCLSCTLLLRGESPMPPDADDLSLELREFRDDFCLPVRSAFAGFKQTGDKMRLRDQLEESLGNFDNVDYRNNQEFAMRMFTIRLLPFKEMQLQTDSTRCPRCQTSFFDPQRVNQAVSDNYIMKTTDDGLMYELHRFSTDGSAAVTKMPECKYLTRRLGAHEEAVFTYRCYGRQELLLVTEPGGNCQLQLTDRTRNERKAVQRKEGAQWARWEMMTTGDCEVRITNPTDQPLAFVLATLERKL